MCQACNQICAADSDVTKGCSKSDGTSVTQTWSQGVSDTVPGSTASTLALPGNGTVSGRINTDGDQDWYRITLTAGQTYVFNVHGSGNNHIIDTILYLRDSAGAELAMNDDVLPNTFTNSRITFTATTTGTYFLDVRGYEASTGGYTLSVNQPAYTIDQVAEFLQTGTNREIKFADGNISVNLTALTAEGQQLARWALDVWDDVGNLVFTETSGAAEITFDDNQAGAFASTNYTLVGDSQGTLTSVNVNISTQWLADYGTARDSYSFETYIHEIGHALGLGHAGTYDGSAQYGTDNIYRNDTRQLTVMSYMDQSNFNGASSRDLQTPQIADIIAIQAHYGAAVTRTGNTIYGHGSTAGSAFNFASYSQAPVFTIYDSGGSDTLNASGYSNNQILRLTAEQFSDIGGLKGNIAIARGVTIENAVGGSGNDFIYGNTANNNLQGGLGSDHLYGGVGADVHNGGDGFDYARYDDAAHGAVRVSLLTPSLNTGVALGDTFVLIEGIVGGAAGDVLYGNAIANTLLGGLGNDTLLGGGGGDRLLGGGGVDYARYDDANWGNLVINLANPSGNTGAAAGDTYNDIEGLMGGVGNDRIGGNNYINYIYGLAGNDIIAGNGGNDTLSGGAGLDTFVFNTALNGATNVDRILDFNVADDVIQIDRTFYGGLAVGALNAANFHTGAAAADAGDRIIYNSATGALIFDSNGNAAGGATQFATLSAGLALTAADFLVIA